jgi:hypothetical protein
MAGRPQKQTVEYFPHDADASEGKTLSILFNHFGHEGISAWWLLLERISKTRNHIISISNSEDVEFLAAKMHFKPDRLSEILKKMADLEAIDPAVFSSGMIWCQNFVDRLEPVYKSRKVSVPTKPELSVPEKPLSGQEIKLSVPEITQSKVKESKVKESKVKNIAPFEKFWEHYPKKKAKQDALKAFSKLNPDEPLLDSMIRNLELATKSEDWLKEGGKFVPFPATWLNGRRWEDEIPTGGSNGGRTGYKTPGTPGRNQNSQQFSGNGSGSGPDSEREIFEPIREDA